MKLTEWGIDDYISETNFSRSKAQMLRYGKSFTRIRCYLIGIFTTIGIAFLFSLNAGSNCISFDNQNCESQEVLFSKAFFVFIAPIVIGVRMVIDEPGIEDRCPHCRGEFSVRKDPSYLPSGVVYLGDVDRYIVDCPYCKREVMIREGYFNKPDELPKSDKG